MLDVITSATATPKIIALDMDGVLADFDLGVEYLLGAPRSSFSKDELDNKINSLLMRGHAVYNTFPQMKDAKELWEYCSKYDPFILTATGHEYPEVAGDQKREWIEENFPYKLTVITVPHSHLKANYATPNRILIDDREKSIIPWREAGGVGILHKNAKDTIAQLKELGL